MGDATLAVFDAVRRATLYWDEATSAALIAILPNMPQATLVCIAASALRIPQRAVAEQAPGVHTVARSLHYCHAIARLLETLPLPRLQEVLQVIDADDVGAPARVADAWFPTVCGLVLGSGPYQWGHIRNGLARFESVLRHPRAMGSGTVRAIAGRFRGPAVREVEGPVRAYLARGGRSARVQVAISALANDNAALMDLLSTACAEEDFHAAVAAALGSGSGAGGGAGGGVGGGDWGGAVTPPSAAQPPAVLAARNIPARILAAHGVQTCQVRVDAFNAALHWYGATPVVCEWADVFEPFAELVGGDAALHGQLVAVARFGAVRPFLQLLVHHAVPPRSRVLREEPHMGGLAAVFADPRLREPSRTRKAAAGQPRARLCNPSLGALVRFLGRDGDTGGVERRLIARLFAPTAAECRTAVAELAAQGAPSTLDRALSYALILSPAFWYIQRPVLQHPCLCSARAQRVAAGVVPTITSVAVYQRLRGHFV
jgi:hypothetical protein